MSTVSMLAYSKTGNGICYFLEATKKEPYNPFKIKKKKHRPLFLYLSSLSNYWFTSCMASFSFFYFVALLYIYLFIFTLHTYIKLKISHTKCSNSSLSPKMLQVTSPPIRVQNSSWHSTCYGQSCNIIVYFKTLF